MKLRSSKNNCNSPLSFSSLLCPPSLLPFFFLPPSSFSTSLHPPLCVLGRVWLLVQVQFRDQMISQGKRSFSSNSYYLVSGRVCVSVCVSVCVLCVMCLKHLNNDSILETINKLNKSHTDTQSEMKVLYKMQSISLVPRHGGGGGESAWYTLFAHAHNYSKGHMAELGCVRLTVHVNSINCHQRIFSFCSRGRYKHHNYMLCIVLYCRIQREMSGTQW